MSFSNAAIRLFTGFGVDSIIMAAGEAVIVALAAASTSAFVENL